MSGPDAQTVWLFCERPTRAGAIADLFAAFDAWPKSIGHLAMSGQIVDARGADPGADEAHLAKQGERSKIYVRR